jgi:hypothetical protein
MKCWEIMPVISRNAVGAWAGFQPSILRDEQSLLPIAIMSWTPIDADSPGPVPIVVPSIVISVVMPVIVIGVVMASVVIWVMPSSVIISRSWRRKKTGNTEHDSKH